MVELRAWVQTVFSFVSLLLIIWGILKVFSRNEMEWRDRERRLSSMESEIATLKGLTPDVAAIRVLLKEMNAEMSRIRDRLDRFVDNR